MRRLTVLASLAVALLCATACSVPRDDNARIVKNPEPDTSAPITRPDGPSTQAKVYFVRSSDNKLEAVTTNVRMAAPGVPPGPYELLEALIVVGPPPDESRLESKIPKGVRFEIRQSPRDKEVIVILPNFNVKNVNRDALILAFQQMVFTLTELPDVNSVQFSVNTELYPVPLRSGGDKQIGEGVRRVGDYEADSIYTTTTSTSTSTTSTTVPPPGPSASLTPGASASVPAGSAPAGSAPPGPSR